jgi:hypothetical protein
MKPVNTAFLLMAQYDGRTIIPLEDVRKDFFSHLTIESLRRKIAAGSIDLLLTPLDTSQKASRGVHLYDLVAYIDRQRAKALEEHRRLYP